jgi:thioredoxin reductase
MEYPFFLTKSKRKVISMISDCVIIGGGPAGLNATLVLGRARRRVILFDNNAPRNAVTKKSHGFITRDGVQHEEFRDIAHEELSKYPTVQVKNEKITKVKKLHEFLFEVTTEQENLFYSRKIILATGLKEILPTLTGVREHYGKSLFSCPYCDGWELRDRPLVLITENEYAFHMIKIIFNWSKDLVVCTNGKEILSIEQKNMLYKKGIEINERIISSLVGVNGQLEKILFLDGTEVERAGGFITPGWKLGSNLGKSLRCQLNSMGGINTDDYGRTSISHVYAAGDTSFIAPSQVIIAAAEGSRAAIGVNSDLTMEDF